MNFVVGTRICSKTGECYKVVGSSENTISLVNLKNTTIVAYKLKDLEAFLPVFGDDDVTCLF